MWAAAIEAFSLIAVMAQDLEQFRIAIIDDPADYASAKPLYLCTVSIAATIDMINSQELEACLSTTGTFSTVMFNHLTTTLFKIFALVSSSGFTVMLTIASHIDCLRFTT